MIDGNGVLQAEYYDKMNLNLELSLLDQKLYVSEEYDNCVIGNMYYDSVTYDVNDGINIMVFDRETQGLVGEFCFTPDGFGNLKKK